ncbi:MAG: hypothetical protein OSJ61_14435 [Lachnospiraceae bacterium]|jgi:hypothetical protein|nr:hypothetical protein [Lachnospiraceae bacterium]
MRDIKEWLNKSAIPFEYAAWKKTPSYPYGVYLDEFEERGADERLFIKDHDINIEIYSDTNASIREAEKKMEQFFKDNAITYKCDGRKWIDAEKHFENSYYFRFVEK